MLMFCFVIHESVEVFDKYIMLVFDTDWECLFFFIAEYININVILLFNFVILFHRHWKFNI